MKLKRSDVIASLAMLVFSLFVYLLGLVLKFSACLIVGLFSSIFWIVVVVIFAVWIILLHK